MDVRFTHDAAEVLHEADAFLRTKPAEHNLLLSLMTDRSAQPEPGEYWWAVDGNDVVGVMFHSPLHFEATIAPTSATAIAAIAAAAAETAPDLPGVFGDAATAARFAGAWASIRKTPAVPTEGQRLYELGALHPPEGVPGGLRVATETDDEMIQSWLRGFEEDTGAEVAPPERIRRRIANGLLWIWEHGEPVGFAGFSAPIEGVARVGLVYTPPARRGNGYAAACTAAVSQAAVNAGATRCILFTQLTNPHSNAIYQRLGYEPIAELVTYRFG
jgi:predicted GNAT family acetyltransferase